MINKIALKVEFFILFMSFLKQIAFSDLQTLTSFLLETRKINYKFDSLSFVKPKSGDS